MLNTSQPASVPAYVCVRESLPFIQPDPSIHPRGLCGIFTEALGLLRTRFGNDKQAKSFIMLIRRLKVLATCFYRIMDSAAMITNFGCVGRVNAHTL